MERKLVIVGAGPVGCLAAIALAKMGWSVEIYEARPGMFLFHHRPPNAEPSPDMRLQSSREAAQQRSINLAISSRGIAAMRAIDPAAASRFLDSVIPMRGRMIHTSDGNLDSQLYDRDGQVRTVFSPFLSSVHTLVPPLCRPWFSLFLKSPSIPSTVPFSTRDSSTRPFPLIPFASFSDIKLCL